METRRLPLWGKLLLTLFMLVFIPSYLRAYGPTVFLYFCDTALFLMFAAMWLESPLLASMASVGILVPQALWMADFLTSLVGFPLVGMTAYMFDPSISLFARGLSLFHFWMPIVLVLMVWRLGYDARAFWRWTLLAYTLMLVSYFFLPPPPIQPAGSDGVQTPVNVNYVFGMSDTAAQTWMSPQAWLLLLMVALPLVCYFPAHWALSRLFARAKVSAA